MALLTIPSAPEKGVPQTYTLNVTDLIALISDTYFQQQTNWSKVVVMYQSSVSNQIEGITFTPDGVSTSLEAAGTFSLEARDVFNVQSITVVDKQNGRNIIYAASIPSVATYTIDFASGGALYVRDFANPNSLLVTETVNADADISNSLLNLYLSPTQDPLYGNMDQSYPMPPGGSYKIRLFISSYVNAGAAIIIQTGQGTILGSISAASLVSAIGQYVDLAVPPLGAATRFMIIYDYLTGGRVAGSVLSISKIEVLDN